MATHILVEVIDNTVHFNQAGNEQDMVARGISILKELGYEDRDIEEFKEYHQFVTSPHIPPYVLQVLEMVS